MATNMIYKYDPNKVRQRPVPADTQSGVPLLINDRPAVTLTARGDATTTVGPVGGFTISYGNGGVGNLPTEATVAFDGTWEFEVDSINDTTGNDQEVYIAPTGVLYLVDAGGTYPLYGYTDYPPGYDRVDGIGPVRIGA